MKQVVRYKLNALLAHRGLFAFTVILILSLNFHALFNSGLLLSGGSKFNPDLKYQLLLNNYLAVNSIYVFLFAVALGSSLIGPDVQSGYIYIVLTGFSSRTKYFIGSFISLLVDLLLVQILLLFNLICLLFLYNISSHYAEIAQVFLQILLNGTVMLTITAAASCFLRGYMAAVAGLFAYAFFNIYMYNQIPFIQMNFVINLTQYRNILFHFVPLVHILPPSYSTPEALAFYQIVPYFLDTRIYQLCYVLFLLAVATVYFKHKDL